jgi:hypothetical protein
METIASTDRGRGAVIAALAAFRTESAGHRPWMPAADLARTVGADTPHDPQFEADVQALFEAGTIRLMSGGNAGGGSFFEAMLVPPGVPPSGRVGVAGTSPTRAKLQDDWRHPRFVATVPGRGYRFLARSSEDEPYAQTDVEDA